MLNGWVNKEMRDADGIKKNQIKPIVHVIR